MGYTLQAIVGRLAVLNTGRGDLPLVALAEDMVMIPLTKSIRSACGEVPFLPFTDGGSGVIPKPLEELCQRLSASGRIAYLEAEFFGGDGSQAMFLVEHGRIVAGLLNDNYISP